ncbi:MAG TPA: hypothetical protein PKN87_07490 [Syntrophomonadaceae bacterium]|nr:hypothetical protein [Syntrophomonadaceae bacterium]HNX29242.1 hypothetical protein [Syntrophomonadaceae bacterium]HPR94564.1 hypothetical protein [Syntrophomonadaceae bacterium]
MRTLVGTIMTNAKEKNIYCKVSKVTESQLKIIRDISQAELEQIGFTFIKLISLDYPDVKAQAIFFEGHLDEMSRSLKEMKKFS